MSTTDEANGVENATDEVGAALGAPADPVVADTLGSSQNEKPVAGVKSGAVPKSVGTSNFNTTKPNSSSATKAISDNKRGAAPKSPSRSVAQRVDENKPIIDSKYNKALKLSQEKTLKDKTNPIVTKQDKTDKSKDSVFKIGENTIVLPNAFDLKFGRTAKDIASDVITYVSSSIAHRPEHVQRYDFETAVEGRVNLHHTRLPPLSLTPQTTWTRYLAENEQQYPVHYTIAWDTPYLKFHLHEDKISEYMNHQVPNVRNIIGTFRGATSATRLVAEGLAPFLPDDRGVYDVSGIYYNAFDLIFKLTEWEYAKDHVVPVWVPPVNRITFLNVCANNDAAVRDCIHGFERAVGSRDLVLPGWWFTDDDLRIMAAIATGPEVLRVARANRMCVWNNFRTQPLHWTLLERFDRRMPAWENLTVEGITAFMKKLASQTNSKEDMVKAYIKISSTHHGIKLSWHEVAGVGTRWRTGWHATHNDEQAAADVELVSAETRAREVKLITKYNRLVAEEARMVEFQAELNDLLAQIPELEPHNREAFYANFYNEVGTWINRPLDALPQNVAWDDEGRRYYTIRLAALEAPLASLRLDLQRIAPMIEEIRRERENNVNRRLNRACWVPACFELGSTQIPHPRFYNVMWMVMILDDTISPTSWWRIDYESLVSLRKRDIYITSAVIGALLSMGFSSVLDLANISGKDLQYYVCGQGYMTGELMQELTISRDKRTENCMWCESAIFAINEIAKVTFNPDMLYMRNFAREWDGYQPKNVAHGYSALSWTSAPYIMRVLSVSWLINRFPSIWGIGTPHITADLTKEIVLYGRAERRGWHSEEGCALIKDIITTNAFFVNVPYALAVLTTLLQHERPIDDLPELECTAYNRSRRGPVHDGVRPYPQIEWDEQSQMIWPGSMLTFDWYTQSARAVCVTGRGYDQWRSRIYGLHPGAEIDAGYIFPESEQTYVSNFTSSLFNLGSMFSDLRVGDKGHPGHSSPADEAGN